MAVESVIRWKRFTCPWCRSLLRAPSALPDSPLDLSAGTDGRGCAGIERQGALDGDVASGEHVVLGVVSVEGESVKEWRLPGKSQDSH